jgi:hypothetical protein
MGLPTMMQRMTKEISTSKNFQTVILTGGTVVSSPQ